MRNPAQRHRASFLVALGLALALAGCSGGGSDGPSGPPGEPNQPPPPAAPTPTPAPEDPTCEGGRPSYASTFEGIQKVIFERHGCTQDACHGSTAQAGLDLRAETAYDAIYERRSSQVALNLIEPGDNDRSYLWMKLAASTEPGSVDITGSPMPNGLPPLSQEELELLALWIYAGAPRDGVVIGSEQVLDACLPDPEPLIIDPLEPPAAGEGVQFVMAPWPLDASSEREVCFATYYDVTQRTPAGFRDETGSLFRFKGFEVRQDPQSHHVLLYYSPLNFEPGGIDVHDPSFGRWTCGGGPNAGAECEPRDLDSCGAEGVCQSEIKTNFACSGFGPSSLEPAQIIGGAGQPQSYTPFAAGVFGELPMKGVIYWNSHAFNLTGSDSQMNGRINYLFAQDQVHRAIRISEFDAIFTPDAAPYTEETYCNDSVFPVGSRIFRLFAHTHKRGKHFWATLHDGTQIYENFSYTDPVQEVFDPPLALDSPDRAERTIRYCATYNNGRNDDGSPNPETVTRLSRVQKAAGPLFGGTCQPVACVAGRVGAACDGEDDDATCDSSPGAGDGWCDACAITGGESTENEMFVLFGAMYIDPEAAAAAAP